MQAFKKMIVSLLDGWWLCTSTYQFFCIPAPIPFSVNVSNCIMFWAVHSILLNTISQKCLAGISSNLVKTVLWIAGRSVFDFARSLWPHGTHFWPLLKNCYIMLIMTQFNPNIKVDKIMKYKTKQVNITTSHSIIMFLLKTIFWPLYSAIPREQKRRLGPYLVEVYIREFCNVWWFGWTVFRNQATLWWRPKQRVALSLLSI